MKVGKLKASKLSERIVGARDRYSTTFHHYGVYMGHYGAGLGNEIFNFAKVQIANNEFPGFIHFPKYRSKLHKLPENFKHKGDKTYWMKMLKAKLFKQLIIIDENLYFKSAENIGSWEYSAVLKEIIRLNPEKKHILHKSKMSGGYLSIKSYRNSILSLISYQKNSKEFSVAIHIRGAINSDKKLRFSKNADYKKENENLTFGAFNFETPLSFYLESLNYLFKNLDQKETIFKIVTNLSSENIKIKSLISFIQKNKFRFKLINDDQIVCLCEIASSELIIPSISSFSLLAIFLSEAKYFWPIKNLYKHENFLSIWGYEERQYKGGPTELNQIIVANGDSDSDLPIRGLPFPFEHQIDLIDWLNENLTNISTDLIYYGVIPV